MTKTSNRLSQHNALESRERISGISIPITSSGYSVTEWQIDEDPSYPAGINHLVIKIPKRSNIKLRDPIQVALISRFDIGIVFDSATTTSLSTTVSGLSGMSTGTHIGWLISGEGIPTGSTIVSVTNPTTVVISNQATVSQLSSAVVFISEYIFINGDTDPVALNKTYSVSYVDNSNLTFTILHVNTELSWSVGEIISISSSAVVYFPYPQRWECENGTISAVTDVFDVKSRYTIAVKPSGSGPVTVSLNNDTQMLVGDNGKDFSFNAKLYSNELVKISCTLEHSLSSFTEPVVTSVYPGRFTAFRSNVEELPLSEEDTYSFDISFTVTGHGGKAMYFTLPNLIEDFLYYSNPYVYSSRASTPDFYWEMDSLQINPSSPLHRLIDCTMTGARDVYEEYLRIYHYEPGQLGILAEQHQTNNTHSVLVNPEYVDSKYAPWLSQFNGHKLKKNISYFYDGLNDVTYTTPQDLFSSPGAIESFSRWQVKNGYYGRAAGTTEALREAARQVLHYTKDGSNSLYFVSITPHYLSDPFKILIQTLINETFDCQISGEESYAILDAVELAKPMGYKIYHQAVDVIEFRVGDRLSGEKLSGGKFIGYPLGDTLD